MTTSTPTPTYSYLGQCQPRYGGCGQPLFTTVVTSDPNDVHWVECPSCGKRAMLKQVQGEYSPGRVCDARCTGAKGNTCRCQCGGANHGKDHRITMVVAVNKPSAPNVKERGHVGEVGKHVRGKVTLVKVNLNSITAATATKSLFIFETTGGDQIKWFVPQQYAPDWKVGKEFTLRAKVIRHDTHERFGKSTSVIYAEEIEDIPEEES